MNDSLTLVPTNELEELKRQAEEINKKIAELSTPTNLACRCKVKPYQLPHTYDFNARNAVVFGKSNCDGDAWKCFLTLGKLIHAKNGIFKMVHRSYRHSPFIEEHGKYIPSKVTELTQEQAQISAEMLDRMIAVYNEYMVRLHPYVFIEYPMGNKSVVPISID